MTQYSQWKYTVLLTSMVLLLGVRFSIGHSRWSSMAIDLCMALVVLAGVIAACTEKHSRVMALILGIPVFVLTIWAQIESPGVSHLTFVLMRAFMTMFLGFTTINILFDLIHQRQITRDTLVGAFCGYVLIGVMWTEMYSWLDLVAPNSFVEASPGPRDEGLEIRWNDLQYFSFVTLTTVGYGDFVPATRPARILACIEAICGQFYLAVLVSGLVSIRVGQFASPAQPPE